MTRCLTMSRRMIASSRLRSNQAYGILLDLGTPLQRDFWWKNQFRNSKADKGTHQEGCQREQIQLQRLTDPPLDGTLPRLVTFVTEFSEKVLDDDYRPILEQVLKIHGSWYHDTNKFIKGLVSVEVYNLIKSLELNLETWAKRYEDASLSLVMNLGSGYEFGIYY